MFDDLIQWMQKYNFDNIEYSISLLTQSYSRNFITHRDSKNIYVLTSLQGYTLYSLSIIEEDISIKKSELTQIYINE